MGLGSNMAGFCAIIVRFLKNVANIQRWYSFFMTNLLFAFFFPPLREATQVSAETFLLTVQNPMLLSSECSPQHSFIHVQPIITDICTTMEEVCGFQAAIFAFVCL